MVKPASMSVREWIIKKIAVNNNISEKIIHSIVTHQFDSISTGMHTNDTLELSGFGKFIFNRKKAEKKLISLYTIREVYLKIIDDPLTLDLKLKNTHVRLIHVNKSITNLKEKLDGII